MKPKGKIELLEKNFGLSSEAIADFVGVSSMSVYRWGRGLKKPHKVFEKKIDELIHIKEFEKKHKII